MQSVPMHCNARTPLGPLAHIARCSFSHPTVCSLLTSFFAQPAVTLAGRLLGTVGAGWASRVFFSDDGSTAIEVALKMAFRKFMHDRGLDAEGGGQPPRELQVSGAW